MKRILLTAFIPILMFFTGCIEIFTTIKLQPDGSGIIEKKVMMRNETIAFISTFLSNRLDSTSKAFDIFDEDKFRLDAADMGKGVTYISGKKQVSENKQGYYIIYSFKDISNLIVEQNPGRLFANPSIDQMEDSSKREESISFKFTKNNPSTLLIIMPSEKLQEESKEKITSAIDTIQFDNEMEGNLKQMLSDMKMSFVVDVQKQIKQTNAAYIEGSKVTIAEINFGKLVDNPNNYKKFLQLKDKTFRQAKEFLNDIPGIKIELNNQVSVKF